MELAAGKRCTSTSSDCCRQRMEIRQSKAARTGSGTSTGTGTNSCTVQGRKECRNIEMQVTAPSSSSAVVIPRTSSCYGVASVIGKRRQMEDAVKVVPGLIKTGSESEALDNYDFFAVYDGHGGAQVAHKCRDRLHMVMAEEVARQWDKPELDQLVRWESTMAESFKRLDAELGAAPEKGSMGSTALVAVVGKSRIVVANCGDSWAVLSRGGKPFALSSDHKPNGPDEMQRIKEAGGTVIDWNGYRVWGILATSRSIGDHQLKPWVSCEPEVTVTDRSPEDEFLILATDGLWDVVSEEMACQIVRNCLHGQPTCTPDTVSDAATLLTQIAMSQGTGDNISVIVVSSTLQ